MARKKIYSDDYAEYRRRYKTYAASKSKRKNYGYVPELPMLTEEEFEIAISQNPSLDPKELAHKSVYGMTLKEKQARIDFLEMMGKAKGNKRWVGELSSTDFAFHFKDELAEFYDILKDAGFSGSEAGKFLSEYAFGSA